MQLKNLHALMKTEHLTCCNKDLVQPNKQKPIGG